MTKNHPHIKIQQPSKILSFKPPTGGGGASKLPIRNQQQHGDYLRSRLTTAWENIEVDDSDMTNSNNGIYLEFISSPAFELCIKSLENLNQEIRLCHVRKELDPDTAEITTYATVFVPILQKDYFFKKITAYLESISENEKPKNNALIASINDIRRALLESFWLNQKDIPKDKPIWCEVWFRHDESDSQNQLAQYVQTLSDLEIEYKAETLIFPERAIKLIYADNNQLNQLITSSNYIAEFRKAPETAAFFIEASPRDQSQWADNLRERIQTNFDTNVAVCILDTGVNYGHPLIAPFLSAKDCLTVNEQWETHDHQGHGSLMAGLVIFGDLQEKLESNLAISINHRIESVKLLPNKGANPIELWGYFTSQAISRAEINEPKRTRIICMAISATNSDGKGFPSSWSGAVDQICSSSENNIDSVSRLILIAAGNSCLYGTLTDLVDYPNFQKKSSIHDPAQAWNALTIGAYTNLTTIKDKTYAAYTPVAQNGQLSPFSSTSHDWDKSSPIKPELVFEGGNLAVDPENFPTGCDDLSLVSTFYKPIEQTFYPFSMTSAATAQAANFAAQIQCAYPDYWPETIRALMVHSAQWTPAMKAQFAKDDKKGELNNILRTCGYGVPNLERAL